MIRHLLLVGGDRRMRLLEPLLRARGYHTETMGLGPSDGGPSDGGPSDDWREAVRRADAVLFPYPYAVREGKVPGLTETGPAPEAIVRETKANALLLAGQGLERYALAENERGKGLRLALYERWEPFRQANAEISAEAAVYEAMALTEETVAGRTLLVAGYGRFGQALAKRLKSLGATVWAAARREKQRLAASGDGMRALPMECMADIAPELSLVLNTVPARVIFAQAMERLPKNCVLMELAGAPGGFDPAEAEKAGLRFVRLPGLPARYAPLSAAKALAEACEKLLTEGKQ